MCPSKTLSSRKPRSLSKLRLPGTLWLASDIHLGPYTPETNRAFLTFLSQAAHQPDALILGGDIFNVWIGDDVIKSPPAWLADILMALQKVAQTTPLFICRGNRDFLMGPALCHFIGAELLDEHTLLETDAGTILFSHGDEYCTDDDTYQRFRYWVRKPWVQRIFLAFSLKKRQKWAGIARARSVQANQHKPSCIMDVNADTVLEAFHRSGAKTIVHGHTHRPGIHQLASPQGTLQRVVLPDWDYDPSPALPQANRTTPRGGWLEISREHGLIMKSPLKLEPAFDSDLS